MNSLENLSMTLESYEKLVANSDRMLEKFTRTENSTLSGIAICEKSQQVPDIIDLFNSIDNRFKMLLDIINKNIDRVYKQRNGRNIYNYLCLVFSGEHSREY